MRSGDLVSTEKQTDEVTEKTGETVMTDGTRDITATYRVRYRDVDECANEVKSLLNNFPLDCRDTGTVVRVIHYSNVYF